MSNRLQRVDDLAATESAADVFFDDITVEHRQGLLVQENHYDPYGLDLAGLSHSSPGLKSLNQYSWNGKEKQAEFGLNWHDHGWRFYDPQLGRWVVVDPEAEEGDQEGWTTYQFGLNNAVRYNDLDGRQAGPGDGALPDDFLARGFLNTLIAPLNLAFQAGAAVLGSAVKPQAYITEDASGGLRGWITEWPLLGELGAKPNPPP